MWRTWQLSSYKEKIYTRCIGMTILNLSKLVMHDYCYKLFFQDTPRQNFCSQKHIVSAIAILLTPINKRILRKKIWYGFPFILRITLTLMLKARVLWSWYGGKTHKRIYRFAFQNVYHLTNNGKTKKTEGSKQKS